MGATLSKFWNRLTECPIKEKPICFYLQKNFKSTGEEIVDNNEPQTDAYDELQNAFITKLERVRKQNKNWLKDAFPYWDQLVIDNLNNIYIMLASEKNGMMDLEKLYQLLFSVTVPEYFL